MTNRRVCRARVRMSARIATALLALCAADLAYAQASQPASADPNALAASQADEGGIQDIVVTARRRAENLQRQPLSISAITTQELEKHNIQRLDDIASIPNVNFNDQTGFVNTMVPYIRGIGEQDPVLTNDSPVSIYVDGVLYARAIGSLLDIIEPERVEVLRGPQGSLFGRNTTGGAISITLQAPTDDFNISFRGGYATNDELTLRGIVNTGDIGSSGIKIKLGYQHHQMDGYVRNLLTSDAKLWPGSDNTDAVTADIHGGGDGPFTFDLRGDYTDTKTSLIANQVTSATPLMIATYGASPSYGGDPFVVSPDYLKSNYFYPTGPRSTGKIGGGSLTLNYAASPEFNVKSITAYRRLHTNAYTNTIGSGNILLPVTNSITGESGIGLATPIIVAQNAFGYSGGDQSHQHQISQELQFSGKAGRHQYVAGLYYFDEDVRERYITQLAFPTGFLDAVYPTTCGAYPGTACNLFGGTNYAATSKSYAAYISDSWTPPVLDDRLEITGGVRYTIDKKSLTFLAMPPLANVAVFHKARFSQPSGDFTARIQWTPDFMTYFRFANGYKAGGFSGRDDPNQEGYGPETANNFEAGFKGTFFDRMLRLNADIFYTKYDNKQVTTYLNGTNSNGIVSSHVANAASARYYGTEIEATLVPTRGLQLDASFGYTNPKFNKFLYQPVAGGPISDISNQAVFPYFSKTTYSLGGQYTFSETPIGELTISTTYSYKSGVYFHPSLVFNPLNDIIKSSALHDLTANATLAHIPISGAHDLSISVYGKNLLNQHHRINGVDYEIVPGLLSYGTNGYNRPRVIGVTANIKY